jgi:hypothetical protein
LGILGSFINSAAEKMIDLGKPSSDVRNEDIVQKITTTKWDLTDDFKVTITNKLIIDDSRFTDHQKDLEFASKYGVISIDIPSMSSQEIDEVIGGIRRNNVRIYESFKFGIRFRDYEGNRLRKLFTTIFIAQQYEYFDSVATSIEITQNESCLFKSEKCLITTIQQQTLDNQNTAINEFEVTFITPEMSNTYIKEFGRNANYSSSFDKK